MHKFAKIVKIEKPTNSKTSTIYAVQMITSACSNCTYSCARQGKPFKVLNKIGIQIQEGCIVQLKPSLYQYFFQGFLSLLTPIVSSVIGYFFAPEIHRELKIGFSDTGRFVCVLGFFLFSSLIVFILSRSTLNLSNGDLTLFEKELEEVLCRQGRLSDAGEIEIELDLPEPVKNSRLTLDVSFAEYDNSYGIYVYTAESQKPEKPDDIYECRTLDDRAKEILEKGGIVFLAPESTRHALPASIKSTFTTDFWSVGTFSSQEGSMGLLIDDKHPLFKDYPT